MNLQGRDEEYNLLSTHYATVSLQADSAAATTGDSSRVGNTTPEGEMGPTGRASSLALSSLL